MGNKNVKAVASYEPGGYVFPEGEVPDPMPSLTGTASGVPIPMEQFNRHGGNATLVELPKLGIKGNTHFLMSDLNNGQLADLFDKWLREQKLDK